jgi:hypothetical protein
MVPMTLADSTLSGVGATRGSTSSEEEKEGETEEAEVSHNPDF